MGGIGVEVSEKVMEKRRRDLRRNVGIANYVEPDEAMVVALGGS